MSKKKGNKPVASPQPIAAVSEPLTSANVPDFLSRPWMPELVLIVAALLVFGSSIAHGFVFFDDDKAILYNRTLQNPSLSKFFSGQNLGMYAPMTWIVYWIGQGISGQDAWGYHLLGVLFHVLNSVVAYDILKRLTGLFWPAFVGALLFAVHPVQAEAICWAAGLSTVLFSTFYLLSIAAYVRQFETGKNAYLWLGLSFTAFLLACLSKSAAVTLPLVLLAVDLYRNKRLTIKDLATKLPYLALAVYFGLKTFATRAAEGHDIEATSAVFSAADRFWMVCQTILFYPAQIALPFLGYSVAYPFVKTGGSWPAFYYAAPVALLALGWLVWKRGRSNPNIWFGAALYVLPLVVMLPFRTVGSFELRSDRYVYVSCLGLFFLLGLLVERLRPQMRLGVVLAAAGAVGIFGFIQSQVWRNGVALFQNCVDRTPQSSLCQCNLGYNALISLDFPTSIRHYSEALRFEPGMVEAHSGRGQAYMQTQQVKEAFDDFDEAIKGGLSTPKLFLNRGKCFVMLGRPQEAIPDLDKSIELEPKSAETWFFRGSAHESVGNFDAAIQDYGKAAELQPDYVEALGNRGFLYLKQNRWELAIADYSAAIAVKPDIPLLFNNRANAYLNTNQAEKALADVDKALSLKPDYKIGHRMRSIILRNMGRMAEAEEALKRSE